MKKFIISSIAALLIVVGAHAASAATAADMGTMTIKAGVPASYVMGLQQNLNVCAMATPALVADGKYGAKTTAAVKAFQMSQGNLTVDGKAGAMTKAALVAKCSGTTTTTTTTGALCPNGMTLASNCMTAPVASTLNGGAGNLQSVTLLGSPSNVQVGEGNSNVPVMAFELRADSGSDLKVTNIGLRFNKQSASVGSTWISRYISSVSVWNGSTLVGTANVADLSQDGTAYIGTVALNNVVVKANSTTQLTVAVTANSTIDTGDAAAIFDGSVSSVRYQDASGAILTTNPTSITQPVRFLKLSTSAAVKLKLSEDANNPKDRTVVANYTSTTNDVSLLKFSVKAEGSDMNIYKIALPATATGVANASSISSYYKLKYNGNIVSSFTLSATGTTPTITFGDTAVAGSTSLNGGLGKITIAKDTTASFEVTADVNSMNTGSGNATNFDMGDTLKVDFPSATLQSTAVTVLDQTGSSLGTSSTNRTGSATGYAATFRIQGISATLASAPTPTTTLNTSGAVTSAQYKVQLNVTATGNDFYIPRSAAFLAGANNTTVPTLTSPSAGISFGILDGGNTYVDGSTAGNIATSGTEVSSSVALISGGVVDPSGRIKVPEGTTAVIELTVTVSEGGTAGDVLGQYKVQVLSVNGADTNTGTIANYNTTPTVSYETAFNTPAFQ